MDDIDGWNNHEKNFEIDSKDKVKYVDKMILFFCLLIYVIVHILCIGEKNDIKSRYNKKHKSKRKYQSHSQFVIVSQSQSHVITQQNSDLQFTTHDNINIVNNSSSDFSPIATKLVEQAASIPGQNDQNDQNDSSHTTSTEPIVNVLNINDDSKNKE